MENRKEGVGIDLFGDFDKLVLNYLKVENTDGYWEEVVAACSGFKKQYPGKLGEEMLLKWLDILEIKGKILRECKGKVLKEKKLTILPERYERMLSDSYEMLDKMRQDPMLKKVYSDVNFHQIISEIESYRDDLQKAEMLFGNR